MICRNRSLACRYRHDPSVICRGYTANTLWWPGYPSQALQRSHEMLLLAQEFVHLFSLTYALGYGAPAVAQAYAQVPVLCQQVGDIAYTPLKPIIDRIFPLDQIVEAYRYMESNEHFGKIVVPV